MKENYYMPLDLNLTGDIRWHYNERDKLPAHELVIRLLLNNCIYCYVYGIKNDNELYLENKDILINEKGKYKIDTTKECITGHEYLWNAHGWKRGSIIIILKNNTNIFEEICKNTYRPSFDGTPNSGNTMSAIKKCKEEMGKGNIGICLPASNGLEWMSIYINENGMKDIVKFAKENCKEVNSKI